MPAAYLKKLEKKNKNKEMMGKGKGEEKEGGKKSVTRKVLSLLRKKGPPA